MDFAYDGVIKDESLTQSQVGGTFAQPAGGLTDSAPGSGGMHVSVSSGPSDTRTNGGGATNVTVDSSQSLTEASGSQAIAVPRTPATSKGTTPSGKKVKVLTRISRKGSVLKMIHYSQTPVGSVPSYDYNIPSYFRRA